MNLSGKYNQKLLDHAEQFTTDVLKTASKRAIIKTVKATVDLTGCKIAEKITKASRTSQNNSETAKNEEENNKLQREMRSERHILPEKRQKIIDDLRRI